MIKSFIEQLLPVFPINDEYNILISYLIVKHVYAHRTLQLFSCSLNFLEFTSLSLFLIPKWQDLAKWNVCWVLHTVLLSIIKQVSLCVCDRGGMDAPRLQGLLSLPNKRCAKVPVSLKSQPEAKQSMSHLYWLSVLSARLCWYVDFLQWERTGVHA